MSSRADTLADRVEQGAREFVACIDNLSDREWQTATLHDGRSVGVVAHHVATAYPIEIDLVRKLASGEGITGVTWEWVAQFNAQHAKEHAKTGKAEVVKLLRSNSAAAAEFVRTLSDEQLDKASPVSLNWDAPLTTQYFIEEHAIGHSYRHRASIQAALNTNTSA